MLIFIFLVGLFIAAIYSIGQNPHLSKVTRNILDKRYHLGKYLNRFNLKIEYIIDNNVWVAPTLSNQPPINKFTTKILIGKESVFDGIIYPTPVEYENILIYRILPENYQLIELDSIDISDNKLLSFNGFPRRIGENCQVINNHLNSFEGSPDFINGQFNVENNNIMNFYHLSSNIKLTQLNVKLNPVYNIYYILQQIAGFGFHSPGFINIFNDYNCWERDGLKLKIDGQTFRDIILDKGGLEFEWIPYSMTWNRNSNFEYSITKIDEDFKRYNTSFDTHKKIHWDFLNNLSLKSYVNIQGFIKIKTNPSNGFPRNSINYIPSIYNFVFPTE